MRRWSSVKGSEVEELGEIVKKEGCIAMVYGGVWDRRIVRCGFLCWMLEWSMVIDVFLFRGF